MERSVPKVAAIQDLSGYGRCSLAVVMPILSCMGMQVCAVPTAVLSTHMGGFGMPAMRDLTDLLDDYINHWKQLGLAFDCIYSGYLGNPEQIHQVSQLIDRCQGRQGALVVVDPVMGDQGKLYSSYDENMIIQMRNLVAKADVITPNWTEVCFLLGESYDTHQHTREQLKDYLRRLAELGPKQVVVTGAIGDQGQKCNMAYDRIKEECWELPYEEIPAHYPGTGDIFTSVLVGGLLMGDSLPLAVSRATSFVKVGVETTYGYGGDTREGIMLEKVLGHLFEAYTPYRYTKI
ncbi:MAG: pyridoxamine kinase [Cellulosilyticaceae bacterium]